MKHLKLALILILFSVQTVWAESFTYMGEIKNNKFYIDSDNIKKNGTFRMVPVIVNNPSKGQKGDFSQVARYEYDCYEEKRRQKTWAMYSELFGKGEVTFTSNANISDEWERVTNVDNDPGPHTIISKKIMNFICAK